MQLLIQTLTHSQMVLEGTHCILVRRCISSHRLFLLYSIEFSWSLRQFLFLFLSFVKVAYMLAFLSGHTGPSRKGLSGFVHYHGSTPFVVRGFIECLLLEAF